MERYQGDQAFIPEGQKREIRSLYAEDMFDIANDFTITLGLRYDKYSDNVGEHLTPRGSLVWRLTDHQFFKVQYAEAFRPPTFTELYSQRNTIIAGNPDLDSEHIHTSEFGYIFRNEKTTVRMTLFYSKLTDNIEHPASSSVQSDGHIQYVNGGDIRMKGFEFEFQQIMRDALRLDGNISFADTEDTDTGEAVEGAAKWMGNIGVAYHLWEDSVLSLQYHYVGKRSRGPADGRDDLKAYDTTDFTLNFLNVFTRGMTLRTGIRNLFDKDIRYPAPAGTYPDDFPSQGREWWAQFSYDFQ